MDFIKVCTEWRIIPWFHPSNYPGICDRKSGLPSISDIFGKLGKPLEIFFVVINNQLIKHHKLYVIFSCLFKNRTTIYSDCLCQIHTKSTICWSWYGDGMGLGRGQSKM